MNRTKTIAKCLCFVGALGVFAAGECPMNGMDGNGNGNNNGNSNTSDVLDNPITLNNLTKLTTNATTASGPVVGDGVFAFNAEGNSILAWLRAGETSADVKEVTPPTGLTHDDSMFFMHGKKLIVQDRNSGTIYVFDTESETAQAIPSASVNVTSGTWAVDGSLVASINSTVTTQDGPNLRVKVTNISNINNFQTTPFNDPSETPSDITVDGDTGLIACRSNTMFFIYDTNNPGDPIRSWTISALQGGVGSGSQMKIEGDFIAFFNDDSNFTLLNHVTGALTQPSRNPGRSNTGLDIEGSIFSYFATQTDDDGSTIAIINRNLVGDTSNVDDLLDPAGVTIAGGDDASLGRVGFGARVAISPNGRFVCIAGAPPVGVGESERLYISIDGGAFRPVVDAADSTGFLRAAGVDCSNTHIAVLIPQDLNSIGTQTTVAYAELPS